MRRAMMIALLATLPLARASATLPTEVVITAPTNFEMLRGDRVSGRLALAAGTKVDLVQIAGDYAVVRYRNVDGRVLIARTNLPRETSSGAATAAVPAQPAPAKADMPKSAASAAAASPAQTPPALPKTAVPAPRAPAGPIERALAGKLVRLEGGALRPQASAQLTGVKFYALYFSASWCGPCREFTPELVDAYGKIRSVYPEFEIIFVSNDRSSSEMIGYMRNDRMAWPALSWDAIRGAGAINRYGGPGIPCLVLVDENGKVLSDSFRSGNYAGPNAVLDDTWKILRDYRRKHPRPKT